MRACSRVLLPACALAVILWGLLLSGCLQSPFPGTPFAQVSPESRTPPPVETVRIEENDRTIVYSPGWKSEQNSQASGGTWTMTGYGTGGYTDSRMTVSFRGTDIALVYYAGPSGGIADVTVDGKAYPAIDTYAKTTETRIATIASGLPDGLHTVVLSPARKSNPDVVLPGGGPGEPQIIIDALEITGQRP